MKKEIMSDEPKLCGFPIVVEDENGLTGVVFYCTRRKDHPTDAHKIFIPSDAVKVAVGETESS